MITIETICKKVTIKSRRYRSFIDDEYLMNDENVHELHNLRDDWMSGRPLYLMLSNPIENDNNDEPVYLLHDYLLLHKHIWDEVSIDAGEDEDTKLYKNLDSEVYKPGDDVIIMNKSAYNKLKSINLIPNPFIEALSSYISAVLGSSVALETDGGDDLFQLLNIRRKCSSRIFEGDSGAITKILKMELNLNDRSKVDLYKFIKLVTQVEDCNFISSSAYIDVYSRLILRTAELRDFNNLEDYDVIIRSESDEDKFIYVFTDMLYINDSIDLYLDILFDKVMIRLVDDFLISTDSNSTAIYNNITKILNYLK